MLFRSLGVSHVDTSKRRVVKPLASPSSPLPAVPGLTHVQIRENALGSGLNPKASTPCEVCWPLGASDLGYCICSDLSICKAQHSGSSASSNDVSLCATRHSSFSTSCKASNSQIEASVAYPSSVPQEANTCPRCWPLGASELGYCICDDLVIAGILPPVLKG